MADICNFTWSWFSGVLIRVLQTLNTTSTLNDISKIDKCRITALPLKNVITSLNILICVDDNEQRVHFLLSLRYPNQISKSRSSVIAFKWNQAATTDMVWFGSTKDIRKNSSKDGQIILNVINVASTYNHTPMDMKWG